MQCVADPDVETELRCGKCDTPICPRCMIQTPVGARCRSCANLRRPAMYTVSPAMVARGAVAAILTAAIVGFLWALLLPHAASLLGFFVFFAAAGYGWLAAEAIGRATNRRRGSALQFVAVISAVLVYLVHNAFIAPHTLVPQNDLLGYIFVVIAGAVGAGYLR